ncbi:MAG: glutamine synthetase [Kineosporiaceae bacterium]|nr:glutamine synthetase [Aeromicrobium sp.]
MTEATAVIDETALNLKISELQNKGVRIVIGSMINASGIAMAKSVPVARLGAFSRSGMGTAPVWDVFTIDGGIALTDKITPVGDRRLRIDLEALRALSGGRAWAPTSIFTQDGLPASTCTRGLLKRIEDQLAEKNLTALVGHELEFVLVNPDGRALDESYWTPYGLSGLLDRAAFVDDLVIEMAAAGISLEQVHAEYGCSQFEFSLPPASPVESADSVILAKIIVGIVARKYNLRASFSPSPFPGSVGSGAHQHFSLARNGSPIFAGGSNVHGITDDGGAAIGGIIAGLPDVQGFLTGSIVSGLRLAPGAWSGAFACWGLENREASVRFLAGGPSNPHGANIEVKIIDPSANVYLASAAVLALALDGITSGRSAPAEIVGDPGALSEEERNEAGVKILSGDPKTIIDALDTSRLARQLLGDDIVDITVAVRRHEQVTFAGENIEALADKFRLAWSI